MNIKTKTAGIPAEVFAEMKKVAEDVANGVRNPKRVKQARESMDRIREEIRQEHGILDIGVSAIRELRDE